MQREKRTVSGPLLEVDFYPIFEDGRRIPERAPKTQASREAQKRYNDQQATKKCVRLVNANFGKDDYFLHLTYKPEAAPKNEQEARRDIANYLRRIKRRREKALEDKTRELASAKNAVRKAPGNTFLLKNVDELRREIKRLKEPIRYLYAIERQTYKTGARAGQDNWHFHAFVSGGLPADEMEKSWNGRVNCARFQPEDFGPEAAARYISKYPQGKKRFAASRNLKKPVEKVRDNGITRAGVEKMARTRRDDREYWERRYPGYRFIRCEARFNEYNGHWYVTCVMYAKEGKKREKTWF